MKLLNDWITLLSYRFVDDLRWNALWKVSANRSWKAPLLIRSRLTKASRHNCNFMEVRINYRPSHPVNQLFSQLMLTRLWSYNLRFFFTLMHTNRCWELALLLTCFSQSKNFVVSPTKKTRINDKNSSTGKAVLPTKSFKQLYSLWNVAITIEHSTWNDN